MPIYLWQLCAAIWCPIDQRHGCTKRKAESIACPKRQPVYWSVRVEQPGRTSRGNLERLCNISPVANKTKRYDTKGTFIDLRRLDPLTATTSSLITVGSGMAGSAVDIVAKPIKAFNRPKAGSSSDTTLQDQNQSQSSLDDVSIYGQPAALNVPGHVAKTKKREPSALKEAVAGSAAGFGGVIKHFSKGMLDAPLAVTEGFRNAPRLYGGKVYEPGRIDGVASGGIAAGKNMAHGIVEGFGGLVMSPMRGARTEGPVGLVKGFGVGCMNMSTKVPSGQDPSPLLCDISLTNVFLGLLGLIFYPSQGLYKSIYTATHRKTRVALKSARQIESDHMAKQKSENVDNTARILRQFDTQSHQRQG